MEGLTVRFFCLLQHGTGPRRELNVAMHAGVLIFLVVVVLWMVDGKTFTSVRFVVGSELE